MFGNFFRLKVSDSRANQLPNPVTSVLNFLYMPTTVGSAAITTQNQRGGGGGWGSVSETKLKSEMWPSMNSIFLRWTPYLNIQVHAT